MKLLGREEVKQLDSKALTKGLALADLIQQVGASLAEQLEALIPINQKVLVVMGPGHNGDDAAVVATRLKEKGHQVQGLTLNGQASDFFPATAPLLTDWKSSDENFDQFDVIIDGLLGTGFAGGLKGDHLHLIEKINRASCLRVAIDIPTGVDCDTGKVGSEALQADYTLTVATPKRGLYLLPGRKYCGVIRVAEVVPLQEGLKKVSPLVHSLPKFDSFKRRPSYDTNKYSRGEVAVFLSADFPGAALMVAMAAQNAGAGYVKVHCPQSLLVSCQLQYPQLVFSPYKDADDMQTIFARETAQCVVLGSGWKPSSIDGDLTFQVDTSYILDGGFLNSQALRHQNISKAQNIVITPHWGELKRLDFLPGPTKWDKVSEFRQQFSGVIVAKGYDTLVAQTGQPVWLTTWNSPSLATAGSGDILCGIIAAFASLGGLPLIEAVGRAVDTHRRLAENFPVVITPSGMLEQLSKILNARA